MSIYRMKLLSIKLTLLSSLLTLAGATYYFSDQYPVGKAFQIGTLLALAVFFGVGILFFLISMLLYSLFSGRGEYTEPESKEDNEPEIYAAQKKERVVPRYETKEEFIEHNSSYEPEKETFETMQQKFAELKEEQGDSADLMLLLPYDLSFLLAKESITSLMFGKIKEENEGSGIILGTIGIGSGHQELQLTIKAATNHSTEINIISRSNSKRQSTKKNLSYINKITKFLKEKEKFYTE